MVEIEVTGAEQLKNVLHSMFVRKKSLCPLMGKLGAAMVGIVDNNFEAEGRPTKWKKRSPLSQKNLAAEAMQRTVGNKKYQRTQRMRTKIKYLRASNLSTRSNKILSQTGDLKKSITYQAEADRVVVGPGGGQPYARIHQLGGIIRPKRAKALAVPYGHRRVLRLQKVTIPARPYLVVPRSDLPLLIRITVRELRQEIYNRLFQGRS